MKWSDVIKELMSKNNTNPSRLAKQLNISNKTITNYANGVNPPSAEKKKALEEIFGVQIDDADKENVTYRYVNDVGSDISVYDSLRFDKNNLIGINEELINLCGNGIYAVKVINNDMFPTLVDGDIVFVNTNLDSVDGDLVYIIYPHGDTTIKRIYHLDNKILLISDSVKQIAVFVDKSKFKIFPISFVLRNRNMIRRGL